MPGTIFAWPLGNPLMKSGSQLGPEKNVLISLLLPQMRFKGIN